MHCLLQFGRPKKSSCKRLTIQMQVDSSLVISTNATKSFVAFHRKLRLVFSLSDAASHDSTSRRCLGSPVPGFRASALPRLRRRLSRGVGAAHASGAGQPLPQHAGRSARAPWCRLFGLKSPNPFRLTRRRLGSTLMRA